MNILWILLGVALVINGAVLCIFSNFNLGLLLTCALGVGCILCGVFHGQIFASPQNGLVRVLKSTVALFVCGFLALCGFLAFYGCRDSVDYREDAVIVLGAGIRGATVTYPLQLRLDKAAAYHRKNPAALIVVTGGQGLQETVTEAYAMEQYLLARGVDPAVIVKEEKATSTAENMRFSKEILDARLGGDYRVAVITNHFHIYRAAQIARAEGFRDAHCLHAGLQWYNLAPCFLREGLAVLKMWILG